MTPFGHKNKLKYGVMYGGFWAAVARGAPSGGAVVWTSARYACVVCGGDRRERWGAGAVSLRRTWLRPARNRKREALGVAVQTAPGPLVTIVRLGRSPRDDEGGNLEGFH